MGKIRINDLARDLEVKSKSILDALIAVGVTEKKTHSSSIEDHEAEKVRNYFRAASDAQKGTSSSRPSRPEADGIKTKIDLSHISKPGDVLKAIISKQQPEPLPQKAVSSPVAAPAGEIKPAVAPPTAAVKIASPATTAGGPAQNSSYQLRR